MIAQPLANGPEPRLQVPKAAATAMRWLAFALPCALLYYAAVRLGLALQFPDDSFAALQPAVAVLVAALLLARSNRRWILLLGVVPAHFAGYADAALPVWRLAAQIAWNAGLALAAIAILRRRVSAAHPFGTTRDLAAYLLWAALMLPAGGSVVAPGTIIALIEEGNALAPPVWLAWRSAFLTNVINFLMLVPAMVLWALNGRRWLRDGTAARRMEAAGIAATAVAVCLLAFLGGRSPAALYALLVPLLWAAARFGAAGVTSVHFLMALLTTTLVVRTPVPIASAGVLDAVFGLQMFLISLALPTLILSVLLDERAADAASLRRTVTALADSEARLRLAFGAGHMAAWDWDRRRKTVRWSAEHHAIMGHDPTGDELRYRDWADRVHPEYLRACERAMEEAVNGRTEYRQEYRLLFPSGAVRWVESCAKPFYDENGACCRVMGLLVDVTRRKEIEQALQASEERYRAVVETQTELVCRFLPDTTLTFANEACCRFLGRPRDAVLGRRLLDLMPAGSSEPLRQHIEAVCRDRETRRFEGRVVLADGTERWQQWVGSVICAPDGSVAEVQSIGRDITDLKEIERDLRESDERFRLVLRATNDVIFDWDMTADTVWWSSNGDALLGSRPPAGRHGGAWLAERIDEEDRDRVIGDLRRAVERGDELWEAELPFRRVDGEIAHVHARGCIVRDAGGQPRRMLGSLMDITDSKRLEEANRRLAHAGRLALAGELTASIAHEINQPLSAISTNAEAGLLLLQSPDPDVGAIAEILGDIREDDLRASAVIGRLRSLLRDRALQWERLDLNEVVREVVRLLRAEAARRSVRLDTELGAVPTLVGDHVQLQQVLLNLMVNGMDSMMDTPEGERRILVTTRSNGGGMIETRVSDTGYGIPPEHMSRLFDSFYTTKRGGMGLGLSIVRSIVAAHGGRIRAESNADGRGATFAVELPTDDVGRGSGAAI